MPISSEFYRAGRRFHLATSLHNSSIVPNSQLLSLRASSNAAPITTKKLIDRYSNKPFGHKPRKDYSDANKSLKGKEDVRVSSSMIGYSDSLNNLSSEEDPNFKKFKFNSCVSTFQGNKEIPKLLRSIGIEKATYYKYIESFCRDVVVGKIRNATYSDCVKVQANQGSFGLERHLLTTYLSHLMPLLSQKEKKTLDFFLRMTDLSNPAAGYPKARRMQRKIIMHVGPTNSGKTYRALEKLKSSNKGIYCGPLRLLAYEVWKRFIDQGFPCDLITGEERISAAEYFTDPTKFSSMESNVNGHTLVRNPTPKESPFFHNQKLVSATAEMLSVNELYDVAVIDEIQLLGDQQRGWAWARALLGVQAHEIHLCGEASAVPIVKDICRELNEEVEVNEYKRLSPLEVSSASLKGFYRDIQEGDCFVAFSRSAIFRHKSAIECITGLKCAVVYGKLPPENRAQQARLFNDPNSPYKVMVASDAVGMGLNLNIRRIIFDSLHKFDGKRLQRVPVPQVKQIAGRAGRFNTAFKDGVAMSFDREHSAYLAYAMNKATQYIKKIGIQPEFESLKLFSYQFPEDTLAQLLIKYTALASLNSRYFICFSEEHLAISQLLAPLPLTLEDRLIFLMAPINTRDKAVSKFATKVAEAHSYGLVAHIDKLIQIPPHNFNAADPSVLEEFEVAHNHRLPYTLNEIERAKVLKTIIEKRLEFLLPRVRLDRSSDPRSKR